MSSSQFGVFGLGVMGRNIALNIADQGVKLSTYNRAIGPEKELLDQFAQLIEEHHDIHIYDDLQAFVASLSRPRKILIMIKAGQAIDEVIKVLLPLLETGDIIIDGGNSHYKDTQRRQELTKSHDIQWIGSGISGGEKGARRGPSMMPSGSRVAYDQISLLLESISAQDASGNACCTYIGEGGSGHFVKMIHNGIEYAEMQLLAEIYDLLKTNHSYAEIGQFLEECKAYGQSSYLLDITIDILNKKEGGHHILDMILDRAGNKGTGSWGSKAALDYGTTNTMMAAAVFCRYMSSYKEERVRLSAEVNAKRQDIGIDLSALKNAYVAARWINHHQGFALIKAASSHYNWDINLSETARIWTNGCIIRSDLMTKCIELFKTKDSILDDDHFIKLIESKRSDLKNILSSAIKAEISIPCFQAAFDYWIHMTRASVPANLIQAQRDYFGAHTYERIDADRGKFFHTQWQE